MQNQLNTTHKHKLIMEHYLNILEQPVPKESIIDEQKLRYIVSQIFIWDYLGIPQANYLALDKNEKSRMFNGFYKNLVLKYFCSKKFFLFVVVCYILETVWN